MSEEVGEGELANAHDRDDRVWGPNVRKLFSSGSVLISGMNGLGVEVAKNVILTGVKVVTIHDSKNTEIADLSSQFYLTEADIGKNRAEASVQRLADLNPYVDVKAITTPLNANLIKNYKSVIIINGTEEELLHVSKICRQVNTKFIAADIYGVFSRVFVDVGNLHVVSDMDGEKLKISPVHLLTRENPVIVKVLDEEQHDFADGDTVVFSNVKGMTEINNLPKPARVKWISNFTFSVDIDGTKFSPYTTDGYVTQVKLPTEIKHVPLEIQLTKPTFVEYDLLNLTRAPSLHAGFAALSVFRARHGGHLPTPHNEVHAAEVAKLAAELYAKLFLTGTDEDKGKPFETATVELLARTAAGNTMPVASVLGGIVAQEVIKLITGKFEPIKQWLYIEHLQILPTPLPTEADAAPTNSRYDGLIAIIGKPAFQKLSNLNVFVVGAGAIGCEHLKNLALLGVATGPKGLAHVTDMDTIELSNLSRQFLFRQADITKPKSERACAAIAKINPQFKTKVYTSKIAIETESLFNNDFWNSLDVVCNALDNVPSRLYVDLRCCFFRKPLLECGTLGTKGNTQVVIPYITENYGAAQDAPEKEIPMCTVRNLPYLIDHTIEYALSLFKNHFNEQPADAALYLRDPNAYGEKLRVTQTADPLEPVRNLHTNLTTALPKNGYADCVAWARRLFQELFVNQIIQLLFNFPADTITKEGIPFWSGKNKLPTPTPFDPTNTSHLLFVAASAYLRAQTYGIALPKDAVATHPTKGKGKELVENGLNLSYIAAAAAKVQIAPFVPKNSLDPSLTEEVATSSSSSSAGGIEKEGSEKKKEEGKSDLKKALELFGQIPKPSDPNSSIKGLKIEPLEFEKDDDSNHHIDFITVTANLRATNYNIPNEDRMKIKGIAGKIIPAIATTTATISGLSLLELFKFTFDPDYPTKYSQFTTAEKDKKVSLYRNWYANLAINNYMFSDPILPKPIDTGSPFTVWDSLKYTFEAGTAKGKGGVPTLQETIARIEQEQKGEGTVDSLTVGPALLYPSIQPKDLARRMQMDIVSVLEEITEEKLPKGTNSITFGVVLNRAGGEEISLPPITIEFPVQKK